MPSHYKKNDKKNEAPKTKFEAEHGYEWQEGEIGVKKPKKGKRPKKAKPKESDAVKSFGDYLKGKFKDISGNIGAVDRYFAEKWKQEYLKKRTREMQAKRKKKKK